MFEGKIEMIHRFSLIIYSKVLNLLNLYYQKRGCQSVLIYIFTLAWIIGPMPVLYSPT